MTGEPRESSEKPSLKRLSHLWRLLALVRPHRVRFAIATVALFIGSGLALVYPQAARLAIDLGISGGSTERLNQVALILAGVFVLQALMVWVRHYLMSWLGERVVADLRGQVFDRILTLSSSWFHERRTGEIVGRLSSDVTVVEGVVGSELSIALRTGAQLVGGIALLFYENAYLTVLMLLVVPPLTIGSVMFGRRIRRMSRAVQDRLADTSAQVQESVGAIQTVQAFVREKHEARNYRNGVEAAFQQALRLAYWRASFMAGVSLAGYIAIGFIIWMGGREVIHGRLSPGDLVAFILYTVIVAGSIGSIAGLWGSLQRAAGATDRLFRIIDTLPSIRDPKDPVPLPSGGGSIRFENVEFHYESRPDHPVLRGVDLKVDPGEVVALVGPSGSGKTTITALILRFFDVIEGCVRFEDVDIRTLRLKDLRRAFALVAQEPVLFSGTIRDNISYARAEATDSEIEQAARDAHAHEFIRAFPDGYDTETGERGVKLSGGQKQRIAIARAILANPRVLILDEATSNLDAESEALVQEALSRLMKGRTTVVIAHRLSTVRDADRIVVIENGCVSEQGTHEELMEKHGAYRRLIEHQVIEADS